MAWGLGVMVLSHVDIRVLKWIRDPQNTTEVNLGAPVSKETAGSRHTSATYFALCPDPVNS